MLDIPQISNTLDQDQNQFLNGKGSAAIILNKNNETSTQFYNIASKTVLSKFFKSRIFDYLTVLGLALIVLLVMQYENKYPLRINQTLVAPPTQLKDGVKQTANKLQDATLSKKIQQTKLQLQSFNNKRENDNFLAGSNQITKLKQIAIPTQTPPTSNAGATGGITVAELSSTTISAAQIANAKRWMDLKNENIFQNTPLAQQQRTYYQKKYNISKYKQLPICLVIPSYNNVEDNRYTNNIRSVVMQEYTNYHIVFIDDASTDGTGQQVQSFLANQKKVPKDRYKVIRNKQQKKAMPNLRMAAKEYCLPQDIYIIVDGDDQLIGRQTLKIFNSAFQSKQVWFVYSNFLNIKGTIGYSRAFPPTIIENNRYRVYPFVTSHLRAFYTQLFLNINQNDLKNEAGEYLKAANDVAICLPILEMSHQKVFYLQQVTYFYNSNTGQNNHQLRAKQQKMNDRLIRRRKRYALLEHLQFASKNTNPRLLSLQNIFQSEKQQFFKNSE